MPDIRESRCSEAWLMSLRFKEESDRSSGSGCETIPTSQNVTCLP